MGGIAKPPGGQQGGPCDDNAQPCTAGSAGAVFNKEEAIDLPLDLLIALQMVYVLPKSRALMNASYINLQKTATQGKSSFLF